jgi:hypothetical protein
MHLHAVDDLQVCVDKCEQGCLACEVPCGREGYAIKHVCDVERVEIEATACNADRFVLTMERCEGVGDVVEVYVRASEVLSCEVGRFVWRRRGENFCSWS